MPKPREVKPWTIYPPTQEDREAIEKKAAEASLSVSAYLCMVGKLACIAVNLPTEQQHKVLSGQEQESKPEPAPIKPAYTLYNTYGKRLSDDDAAYVEQQIAAKKTEFVCDKEDGSKEYACKKVGPDDIDSNFYFVMRPVKGV